MQRVWPTAFRLPGLSLPLAFPAVTGLGFPMAPVVKGNASLEAALKQGTTHWKNYYGERLVIKMYEEIAHRKWKNTARCLSQLIIHYPERLTRKVLGTNRHNGHTIP